MQHFICAHLLGQIQARFVHVGDKYARAPGGPRGLQA